MRFSEPTFFRDRTPARSRQPIPLPHRFPVATQLPFWHATLSTMRPIHVLGGKTQPREARADSQRGTASFSRQSDDCAQLRYEIRQPRRSITWEPIRFGVQDAIEAARDAEIDSVTAELRTLRESLAALLPDHGDAVPIDSCDEWREDRTWEDSGSAITIEASHHQGEQHLSESASDGALISAAIENLITVKRESLTALYRDIARDVTTGRNCAAHDQISCDPPATAVFSPPSPPCSADTPDTGVQL